jgi:hypothetical protein
MTQLKKYSLPALRIRNPFAVLARRRAAVRLRARPRPQHLHQVVRDEVDEWLHRIRSAGM